MYLPNFRIASLGKDSNPPLNIFWHILVVQSNGREIFYHKYMYILPAEICLRTKKTNRRFRRLPYQNEQSWALVSNPFQTECNACFFLADAFLIRNKMQKK